MSNVHYAEGKVFRSYKTPTQKKSSKKQDTPVTTRTVQSPTLQMQSLIGNHATQQMIQRMPTHGVILKALGQPKAHKTIMGRVIKQNSTKYRAVLDAVLAYDNFLKDTMLGATKGEIQGQFLSASALLNRIQTTMAAYDGKKDAKAVYFAGKKVEIEREKSTLASSMIKVINNPVDYANLSSIGRGVRPKFMTVLKPEATPQLRGAGIGSDAGGTSEVTEYTGGYFKANKTTLYNPEGRLDHREGENEDSKSSRGDSLALEDYEQLVTEHGEDKGKKIHAGLENERTFGVKLAGINANDARMAKRDVASSRLNQLLSANIVAKAQLSVQHLGDGKQVEGSLMEKATGKSMNKMASEDRFYDPSKGETKTGTQQTSLEDPKLMQMLSKLQLIDQLAFQVDRNTGNYFIRTDGSGNVVGITGIDNDFALGTATDINKRNDKLPAMSRFADEELATAIINLDPEVLKMAMADLLDESEIAALLIRLKTMQDFLKPLQTRGELLKPGQWNSAMAKNLLNERTGKTSAFNYYQQMVSAQQGLKPRG